MTTSNMIAIGVINANFGVAPTASQIAAGGGAVFYDVTATTRVYYVIKPDLSGFVVFGGSGGGVSQYTSLTDAATANLPGVNAPLAAALAKVIGVPQNWDGTTPALASGVNPIAFGTNAYIYTGSGSPTLDGNTFATGDMALFSTSLSAFTKVIFSGAFLGTFANTAALPAAAQNTGNLALIGTVFWLSNGAAWISIISSAQVGVTGGVAPNGDTVQISGNVTISPANANAATYNGKTLEFTGAFTVTLGVGLPNDFGFNAIPPASGNASIASDGTTTINGTTSTIARGFATYTMFFVQQRNTNRNAYLAN